ncbi:hypothetical protein AWB99_10425 [Mycolicibacterium confluentis]|nr:hypothetical protein [Mycolicibacterium confluentis]ORV32305.1 hypothetical protein AWB99_10425 [Mycolicibacterium confluentis]
MAGRLGASAPQGADEVVYSNQKALWVCTRWGRIVEQRDFYEDTQRLIDLDRRLPSPSSRT